MASKDLSPLAWEQFFDKKERLTTSDGDEFCVYVKGWQGPLFFLLHGGGYTGLTWACFAEELSQKIDCRIVAPDLRGHGETICRDETDLSTTRQISDIHTIYSLLFGDEHPPLVLIGHSMGGALAINVAHSTLLPNLQVLSVIDVVEGSAMACLASMPSFIRSRPQKFASTEEAITWSLGHSCKNARAARISMPSQIRSTLDQSGERIFVWRTDLAKTEPYWSGWFQNLSKMFLDIAAVKILILADVDRLDKELLTAQMKGMFQTEVLAKVGHTVQEDSPGPLADIFCKLVSRYKVVFGNATKM